MSSLMKALYDIRMPGAKDASDRERNVENVNEDRLNGNFREIANELLKLWASNDHTLNFLSAQIEDANESFTALGSQVVQNSSAILLLPDQVIQQVATVIRQYADTGEGDSNYLTQAIQSLITQSSNEIMVAFENSETVTGLQSGLGDVQRNVTTLSSWVRVISGEGMQTQPGVAIGRSNSAYKFKAEADTIYFYKGEDESAAWANAEAGLSAEGRFLAKKASIESMLLCRAFDVDTVEAKINGVNVEFLHITGR